MIVKVYENLDEPAASRDRRFLYVGRNQHTIFGISVDLKKRITLTRPANVIEIRRYKLNTVDLVEFIETANLGRVALTPGPYIDPLALDRQEREDR